ncbi:Asp-tRNA(Asn)/Glu-tRNA(Gln) amidotransferase subunit GatB [Archaeoglobus veneficus]|uniref:Aspartyl/glutamyl-tRNA(Asn/Gln) amidotransferase subunit B n=1 Tax=Archaeoglobus veneficus (strain DSM 11195 / SNP6) TaxID=693661 RepID=F2KQI3_ARCVS|nr:Asp-tRNA(Asn)/Glu-tRNA(Gln) amidotransferase subunit GatB [Archaeoglobus veneficus]AEA47716.1 Aspartyl/glutamyl-tRNA(Asn/Gln) amidotransferase subunit B [Archaeoglobus veneficus SNP6]
MDDVVIGLEVHVQLNKLNTKLFCSCPINYHESEPNTHVCPVCLGMPGAMPVVNREAVKAAIKVALALHADIQSFTVFDRKNYFYPDLPKGFQISQYDRPLAWGGYVTIEVDGEEKKIALKRIHMEEDPGKLSYKGSITTARYSLIDYNRSGVPLLEIVTEPVMHSPKEARLFLNKLRIILEYLDVFDGSLEGAMRVDANVSIKGGGRVEIKNISSFKGVEKALSYEITRQRNLIRRGRAVRRETRHFDEANNITVSLRGKEEEQDYRYFPEPDLVPVYTSELLEEVKGTLPEMPEEKRERFIKQYGLSDAFAKVLVLDVKMANYFEEVASVINPRLAASWIVDVLRGELNYRSWDFGMAFERLKPEEMAKLLKYFEEERITEKGVVEVIRTKLDEGGEIDEIIEAKGLFAIPKSEIERLCREAIENNPKAVEDYRSGKKQALNFLVGQVMKATRGRADPGETAKIMKEILG